MTKQEEIRERQAELEHEQWIVWAKAITPELNDILYKLPEGSIEADGLARRLERWASLFKPYAELTEEQKDQDRVWADKTLAGLHSQGVVIKVNRELPKSEFEPRDERTRKIFKSHRVGIMMGAEMMRVKFIEAGWRATEPLI